MREGTTAPTSLLIRDARLVPVHAEDRAPEHPVDVLVEGGRVAEVGERLQRRPGTEEHDAAGRWLVPGLWDAHVHLGQWTLSQQRLDTGRLRSVDEAVALVAATVAEQPGKPVVAWGHRPATWTTEPTVAALDAVSGVTPVILIAGDGHHAWLNSAAQAALGIAVREDMVRENEWYAAYDRLFEITAGDGISPAAYRATLDRAAAMGVVGLVDLEFVGGYRAWRDRWGQGCDRLRIRAAVYTEGMEQAVEEGLRSGDPLVPGDDRLVMGPLKIISDGSINTRTAWCHEPYAVGGHPAQPAGAPNLSGDELTALLQRAHDHGLEVATHAIGDAAVAQALTAYDATGAKGSIEHLQLVAHEDVDRLARLGLRASMQPHHLVDDRDLTEIVWPGRAERCFALRWLTEAGVAITLGSDAPVSPLDPWLAIDAAVRRTGDDRPAWHGEQALSRQEALAASVDGQPMVRPGSRGDLALVDQDPLDETAASPAVALTTVAGHVVHRAG
ncbi:MAG TPA: amidohydrolase family protein [Nocardioides sp.]|nr:amidohydrolase family protein [Nocardioides sp.]